MAAAIALGNTGRLDATRARLLAGSARLGDADDNWSARLALTGARDQATLLGATSLALLGRRDLRSVGLRCRATPPRRSPYPRSSSLRFIKKLKQVGSST
jgi:hypothetical protein